MKLQFAPIQVVIVPIAMHKEGVRERANELYKELKHNYRTKLDDREQYSPGYKFNDWEMRGVPIRIELGPKDIQANKCIVVRRDDQEKIEVPLNNINEKLNEILDEIQDNMFKICKENTIKKTTNATNMDEFMKSLESNQGYIKAMWCGDAECEKKIHELTGAKSRCIPFKQEVISGNCVCCNKKAIQMVYWGRQY